MLILFDHGTPRGLIKMLPNHTVCTARSQGWERLSNGDLLNAAEDAGFLLLLTTEQRIRYQQNLQGRSIAILVLTGTTKCSQVQLHIKRIVEAIDRTIEGDYLEVMIPFH